jgi:hypothetical protein
MCSQALKVQKNNLVMVNTKIIRHEAQKYPSISWSNGLLIKVSGLRVETHLTNKATRQSQLLNQGQ